MGEYKTPGVYIKEKNAFGNSVVEAETAIPVFIGRTEKAEDRTTSLLYRPVRISSLTEYRKYFGGASIPKFELSIHKDDQGKTTIKENKGNPNEEPPKDKEPLMSVGKLEANLKGELCTLYYNLILFFANGGGTCYIVSIGDYTKNLSDSYTPNKEIILENIKKEQDITMLVVPEAANDKNWKNIYTDLLMWCDSKQYFALLDVPMINSSGKELTDPIENFRDNIGSTNLQFAAAYYPWLETSVLSDGDITEEMMILNYNIEEKSIKEVFGNNELLFNYIKNGFEKINLKSITDAIAKLIDKGTNNLSEDEKEKLKALKKEEKEKQDAIAKLIDKGIDNLSEDEKEKLKTLKKEEKEKQDVIAGLISKGIEKLSEDEKKELKKLEEEKQSKLLNDENKAKLKKEMHNVLFQNSSIYRQLALKIKDYINLLPPSAAMAGVYTRIDNTRGVWKAPANISINYVNRPERLITHNEQEDLNAPINGKSINAIRIFPGEGIKVWGARTLDGNSLDWRYINVRRTMTFLEQSVKNAARAYVFEPNDANTWINMRCMIENFLRGVWKRGGLAGTSPEEAFEVHIGLGDTMTSEDILEGIMRITVLAAISRPTEFIEITFQQQMQKS